MIKSQGQLIIHPTGETISDWIQHFIPELDVWFWDEVLDLDLSGCMVMTREDYLKHPAFQDIRYVNAYLHWQIPSTVCQVIVSGREWVTRLDHDERMLLFEKQVSLKRGMVIPLSFLDTVTPEIYPYVTGDSVLLCRALWEELPTDIQHTIVLREQRRWDDVESHPVPPNLPGHIQTIANRFGEIEGANCLGTTAYCVTGEGWMRHFWMYQAPFVDIITRHGYHQAPGSAPATGDIVTFSVDDTIVHAAFCIGEDRFLNKNGQSRFNPVRIVDRQRLSADWSSATCVTWRRQQPDPAMG